MTGPEDLSDPDSPINAPRVYVTMVDETDELHLIIYQAGGVKMCWLVDGSTVMDLSFYQKLHTFVGANAVDIDALIKMQQKKRAESAVEIQYKYLYFNHMNLAQKSSFMTLPKNVRVRVRAISPYLYHLLRFELLLLLHFFLFQSINALAFSFSFFFFYKIARPRRFLLFVLSTGFAVFPLIYIF